MTTRKLAPRISLVAAAALLGITATAGAAVIVNEASLANKINIAEESANARLETYMSQAAGLRGDTLDAGVVNVSGFGDHVVHGALGVDTMVTLDALAQGIASDFVYLYLPNGGDVPSGFYTPVWYADTGADGQLVSWMELEDRFGRVMGTFDTDLTYDGDEAMAARISLSAGVEHDPATGQTSVYIDIHWTRGTAKAKIGG